jgi:hypothetical protein
MAFAVVWLTLWSRVHPEKLTGAQLVRKVLAFYVRYCIHKHLPPVRVLSQTNPVHASPSHFLKIYFYIILPFTPRSYKWSYIPGTNYVPRVCNVTAVLWMQCVVHTMLFPMINVLYILCLHLSKVCAQCPVQLWFVLLSWCAFQVCCLDIFWMFFIWFQLLLLLLVLLLILHFAYAEFLL